MLTRIAAKLKKARLDLGMTALDVAREADINPNSVYRIEKGETDIYLSSVLLLLQVYELPFSYLDEEDYNETTPSPRPEERSKIAQIAKAAGLEEGDIDLDSILCSVIAMGSTIDRLTQERDDYQQAATDAENVAHAIRSELARLTRERDEVRAELTRRNREEGAYQQSVVDALRLDDLPHRKSGSHLDTPDRIRWLIEQRDAARAVVARLLGEPTSKPVDGDPMDGIAWVRQQETDRHRQREAGRWADMIQRATKRADELARLRGALERMVEVFGRRQDLLFSQRQAIEAARAALAGEGEENIAEDSYFYMAELLEPHTRRQGGSLPESVVESFQMLLEHWTKSRAGEGEVEEDTTTIPFCACGRRVSDCDGSRKGCGKTPEKAREA